MKITFGSKKLEEQAIDEKKCQKKMGKERTKLFYKRLNDLSDAHTLDDVRNLPGHYHELTGNRKGQWACNLDQPYRLIFKPLKDPIPTNESGQYIWLEITGVEIIEVTNYHGK